MKHLARLLLLPGCIAAIAALQPAVAAYLESDVDPARRVEPSPPQRIVRPRPSNPVWNLVRRVEVGAPASHRGLTVFPLVLRSSRSAGIRTLDEALSRGWLEVLEKSDAQVSHVRVRNRSGRPVFLMVGEILAGGKQDRVVRDDVLIPPHSKAIDVPVYCGEQDRWTTTPGTFKGDGTLAAPGLRRMAARAESQGAIWSEIDSQMKSAGVASRTRSYRQLYRDRDVDRTLRKYAAELRRICRGQTVGAVFASRGRIVGCDVFNDPDLLDKLWNKICRSYATDLVSDRRYRRSPPGVDRQDVRRFLDRVAAASVQRVHTPGAGELYRLGSVEGHALVWRDEVVHCVVFSAPLHIMPPPRPIPLPHPVPRR